MWRLGRSAVLAIALWCVSSDLAWGAGDPLTVVHASGAPRVSQLTPSTETRYLVAPCWDRRGRLVAMADAYPAALLERRARPSGEPVRLRRFPGLIDGMFAPGCARIAELRMRDGVATGGDGIDVWLDGRLVLRTEAYWEARPQIAWSPDATHLLIAEREHGRLYVVEARSRRIVRRLKTGPGLEITHQSLSRGGGRAVFSTRDVDSAVALLDVRNGKVTQIAAGHGASFDPPGQRIAFADADGLALVDINGAALIRVTSAVAQTPSWSPDGRRLAFVGQRRGLSETVAVVAAQAGATPSTRVARRDWALAQPVWSPDGRRLAFSGFSLAG